ncbi:MAG: DNA polymerase ligase N-terminal domain-containing protein [Wenzhouxiangellaceae bacterium]
MTSNKDKLDTYKKKRNSGSTPEPLRNGGGGRQGKRRFLIQKHQASSLHYDFRLEFDGVLKSWSVPKGPSTDPAAKRLAIRTEDHPLDYADFEGVIPEDQYGGGTVMIWDAGTYRNLRATKGEDALDMPGSLKGGRIEVWLEGEKLRGGFALKRIRGGKQAQWLLIKMNDDEADARRNPISTQNHSVKTGRTMRQIAKDGDGQQ